MRLIRGLVFAPVMASLVLTACFGDPWRKVNRKDTLADYRRYVQQYPESRNRVKAEEHMAFLELEREPTLDGYASFKTEYPDSKLADSLRDDLEPRAFERARFAGTPAAYTDFMVLYSEGPFAERALGNMVFLEAGGFSKGVGGLGDFASAHPSSDYTAEALRSLAAIELKTREHFDRVGLMVRVSPETPEVSRVVGAFTDHARHRFKSAGYQLVEVPELQTKAQRKQMPRARLVIEHREALEKAKLNKGDFARPGLVATTRVSLYSEMGTQPVWQRVFRLRLDKQQHFAGTSILFNPNARSYWASFFVPVASWPNRAVLRKAVAAEKEIVAVDSAGDRTVILFADGEFQLLEFANAESVFPLAKYSRPKDFTRWGGVKILGSRILLYGEDGVEVVGFGKSGPRKLGSQERQAVGSIVAAVPYDKELLLASNRGLLMTDRNAGNPRRLLRRPIRGLDRVRDSLVFSDGESVFISTLELLGQQRILQQVELGYEFGPYRVVGFDRKALVLGKQGVVVLDLANPAKPKIASRLTTKQIGKVEDATAVGGRVFLVGDRGLQMLDSKARTVVESVDIQPKQRVAQMGRFLVVTGQEGLQVIDSSPLTLAVRPAPKGGGVAAPSE